MSDQAEHVIDGNAINASLQTYGLKSSMLTGQVFEIVKKKLILSLTDEIDKEKPHVVRFVNLEAIPNGPYGDFMYAICGALAELADTLIGKGIGLAGTINDPRVLPSNIVHRISKGPKTTKPAH